MNDIERYTTDVDGQLMQSGTGELVHYSDYLELKAKRDELLAVLAALVGVAEVVIPEGYTMRKARAAIAKARGQQ